MKGIAAWLENKFLERGRGGAASLARALRVRDGTVSRWVRGEAKPDFVSCLKIAEYYRVPSRMIMELTSPEFVDLWERFFGQSRHDKSLRPPEPEEVYPETVEMHEKLEEILRSGQPTTITAVTDNLNEFFELIVLRRSLDPPGKLSVHPAAARSPQPLKRKSG